MRMGSARRAQQRSFAPAHTYRHWRTPVSVCADFDKSLIEQNSDYVVVEELDADLLEHLMTNRGKDGIPEQFTDLIVCGLGFGPL